MGFWNDMALVFGRSPRKPARISEAAAALHASKRGKGVKRAQLLEEIRGAHSKHTWRNRRWACLLGINLLFTLSFWVDIQLLEGSLTASRLLGFHLADVYSSILVMLAQRHVAVNLLILEGLIARYLVRYSMDRNLYILG